MRTASDARNLDPVATRRLQPYLGDWTVLLNHDARIVFEVGGRDRVLGGAPGISSIGRHILSFVVEEDLPIAFDNMETALTSLGTAVTVPFQIRARTDGASQLVDVLAVNRFDDPHLNAMILRVNRIPMGSSGSGAESPNAVRPPGPLPPTGA